MAAGRTLQRRKYHELIGGELGRDNAALIAGCGGKSFLGPLDLENPCLPPRPWRFAQFRSANEPRWKHPCFRFQNQNARADRWKTNAPRWSLLGYGKYGRTEWLFHYRSTGNAREHRPSARASSRQRNPQFATSSLYYRGWANGCDSTASSVHPVEFNSSKDFVSPWAKARTSSAASRALSRLPART